MSIVKRITLTQPFQLEAASPSDMASLAQQIGQTFIIAYRECTTRLENSLQQEGLVCEVLRQEPKPEYESYAALYRCMLNHWRAWKQAAQTERPTLIVEADFVPVIGFGQRPLPFATHYPDNGIAWLYTCAAQLYSVTAEGYAEGFSTALVAYVVTPQAAQYLCELATFITQTYGTGYYNFDSDIDGFLRSKGLKNYLAFQNYGEHGGKANPEHRRHGFTGTHRADVLCDRLAFLPMYASDTRFPWMTIGWVRLQARLKGVGRLICGKFLRLNVLKHSHVPLRLIRFAVGRQWKF